MCLSGETCLPADWCFQWASTMKYPTKRTSSLSQWNKILLKKLLTSHSNKTDHHGTTEILVKNGIKQKYTYLTLGQAKWQKLEISSE